MKAKFLLADDDADDGSLFHEAVLQVSIEMECRTVQNGRELFKLLASDSGNLPEIIFLDINMPIMSGWECLETLKQDIRYKSIPIIMYSTSSMKTDVERAYSLGAHLFITKPESFDELCQIVKIIATDSTGLFSSALRAYGSVKMS